MCEELVCVCVREREELVCEMSECMKECWRSGHQVSKWGMLKKRAREGMEWWENVGQHAAAVGKSLVVPQGLIPEKPERSIFIRAPFQEVNK